MQDPKPGVIRLGPISLAFREDGSDAGLEGDGVGSTDPNHKQHCSAEGEGTGIDGEGGNQTGRPVKDRKWRSKVEVQQMLGHGYAISLNQFQMRSVALCSAYLMPS